jgi:hypothetical protein
MNRRQGGHQSLYWCLQEEENLLTLPGFESRTVQTVAWSLYRLPGNQNYRSPGRDLMLDLQTANQNLQLQRTAARKLSIWRSCTTDAYLHRQDTATQIATSSLLFFQRSGFTLSARHTRRPQFGTQTTASSKKKKTNVQPPTSISSGSNASAERNVFAWDIKHETWGYMAFLTHSLQHLQTEVLKIYNRLLLHRSLFIQKLSI